jgi:hypothetical protein
LKQRKNIMGLAQYSIISVPSGWGILHDGEIEGDHATKEAAFEAVVAAASMAIREGHEVQISVPGRDVDNHVPPLSTLTR